MKVQFYVLNSGGESERISKACELTENAWLNGHRVWLTANDDALAQYVDKALWTFRQDSFVPHERLGDELPPQAPVVITPPARLPELPAGVVINLAATPVAACAAAERVVEVLSAADESRAAGRERYRAYRDAGCELDTVHV